MERSRRFSRDILVLLFAAFLLSCSADPDTAIEFQGYSVRDSAGVEIIENSSPAWGDGEAWSLTEEPLLTIGAMDGPEEYVLYRAASPIRLDDGRFLVADGGSQDIKFYGPDGRFLQSAGSDGEGPGEFRGIGWIWRTGADSLAVLDYRLYRISVFDLHGGFGRSFRLGEGSNELPFADGVFADGSVLASVSAEDTGDYTEAGMIRDRLEYRRYDRDGNLAAGLATLPGWELYKGIHPDGSGFTMSTRYSVQPWVFVAGDTWYYGPGDAFEIQERSQDGDLRRIIRLDRERRAPPAEGMTSLQTTTGSASGGAVQSREIPLPDLLPAHEQILRDAAGHLWLAEYVVLEEVPRWMVFDPSGRWLGWVEMPPGGRIFEIGTDYVLGVWRDELDVQTVRMYGIVKPG